MRQGTAALVGQESRAQQDQWLGAGCRCLTSHYCASVRLVRTAIRGIPSNSLFRRASIIQIAIGAAAGLAWDGAASALPVNRRTRAKPPRFPDPKASPCRRAPKTYNPRMVDSTREPLATGPVIETKFYIPRWRPGSVARPRLLERLNRGTESKVTLVSAPAGFGKTTLLAEWLATAPAGDRSVAWLSLDVNDNHPSSFWTYLLNALQTVEPAVGAGGLALLRSFQSPPMESLLGALLNEIAAISHDVVLVLDDYHLIDASPIHEGIAFLLDHLPPRMHLVIAGRADPPLPLARLRGRGELTEIRAADLRFTPEEAAAFLNEAMGLDLSAQHVAALDARAEGWIAGLQLAGLSMQGREDIDGFIAAFTGNDRYIVDYLVEEVLDHQPDEVRRFLLQTSILARLGGALCDAVTGSADGNALLERLERGNLFVVPLDDQRQWYRYQHLFADVLHAHLLEEQPDEIPTLHGRASAWFEQNAQPSDAIQHAVAANDLRRAAGLVELEAEVTIRAHQPDRLLEWLKPIPDELVRSMPVLSTYYAFALQGLGQLDAAEARLCDAERWLGVAPERADEAAPSQEMLVVDRAGFEALPSRIALARGYQSIASGDVAGTVEPARRALELLPRDEHHWRGTAAALLALAHWRDGDLKPAWRYHAQAVASLERAGDIVLAMSTIYHGCQLLTARGHLTEARSHYEHALQLAAQHGESAKPGKTNHYIGLSELCCEQGDLEAAAEHLQHGEDIRNSPALPGIPYRWHIARARLLQAQGDLAGALTMLDRADGLRVQGAVPDLRPLAALKMRLKLKQGGLAEALEWTREQALSADDELRYPQEYQHITLARVLIAQATREKDVRSLHDVDRLLARLLQSAEAGGRGAAVIELLMLRAIVHQALGDIPAALVHFGRALRLAEPESYVRLFVDEGEPVRDLLRQATAAGIGGSYTSRLLSAFEERRDSMPRGPRVGAGLTESLTAREVEILRLITAGMRNQEIADQLVISLPTVKRHIANVYGKLGVDHRTEAVARANELSLL